MKKIEVDDEVYRLIQKRAIAYEEKSPNDTLRRILRLGRKAATPKGSAKNKVSPGARRSAADLQTLVSAEVLTEGQTLHLRDYSGNRVEGCEAMLSKGKLRFGGRLYSMSALAQRLLARHGHKAKAVRGPIFWFTQDDRSINDLWEAFVKEV